MHYQNLNELSRQLHCLEYAGGEFSSNLHFKKYFFSILPVPYVIIKAAYKKERSKLN